MAEITAPRESWKLALICVIAIELAGGLSGWLSNAGYGNPWFDALQKPFFMPPGWMFGVVWPILYALMGVALAMVIAEPPLPRKEAAITFFLIQLGLNLLWSPIFFAGHDIGLAKWVIFAMTIIAALAARRFLRINRTAGLLLVPYLAWLIFASVLNTTIDSLNPGAGTSLLAQMAK